MIKFMINYIKEEPINFLKELFTALAIFAMGYVMYFLGWVIFGA